MEWWVTLILLWALLVGFFFTGIPVAFAFIIMNIIGLYVWAGGASSFTLIAPSMFNTLSNFILVPIPLFILMGEILACSGVAWIIVESLDKWIGRIPGRLSLLAIGAGTIFASVSGVPMGTTAMLASVFFPEMRRRGYSKQMSVGPILGGGGLALIIPPTVIGVLLAAIAEVSVGNLLIAIIIPGFLLSALYTIYVLFRAIFQPHTAPPYVSTGISLWERVIALRHILPITAIIFLVTGVIFVGVATPSEASALGAAGCFVLAAGYGRLNMKVIKRALTNTSQISVMVLIIIAGSVTFSQVLAYTGSTKALVSFVVGLNMSPIVIIIFMHIIVLLLGCFMDLISVIMISIPILMPVVQALGFDPIWFCTTILVNLGIGMLTPPVGLLLFTIKGVLPDDISVSDIVRSSIPYFLMGMLTIAFIIIFPGMALWLPNVMK